MPAGSQRAPGALASIRLVPRMHWRRRAAHWLRHRPPLEVIALGLGFALPAQANPWLTLSGERAGDRLGVAVARLGDVNGDGYPDFAVGADSHAGPLGPFQGRVYIYFGGPQVDDVPDWVLDGEAAADRFGISVAGAGDVNGDGIDDIIVGAIWNDTAAFNAGAAYVFYGGHATHSTPDLTFTGEIASQNFGDPVAGAGDLDGDGYDDLVVGVDQVGNAGRVYVYHGGPNADGIADGIVQPQHASEAFGHSVAGVGDVNGDGFDDLLIGAPKNNSVLTWAGRAYLYLGGHELGSVPSLILQGKKLGYSFGFSVAPAGDVNGDGHPDFIVGDNGGDAFAPVPSQAFVFYGGPAMDNQPDVVLTSEERNDRFGSTVSGAGDLNADGYDDVVVGAFRSDVAATDAGRASVYFGSATADSIVDWVLDGEAENNFYSTAIAGVGDLNGDGAGELLAGALLNSAVGASAGRAYVYKGTPRTPVTATLEADQLADGIQLRWEVHSSEALAAIRLQRAGLGDGPRVVATWHGMPRIARGEWSDHDVRAGLLYSYSLLGDAVGGPLVLAERQVLRTAAGPAPRSRLLPNVPNPFNPRTEIRFELARPAAPRLALYDATGHRIRLVRLPRLPAGPGHWTWDGRDDFGRAVTSGIYCVMLQVDGHRDTRRLTLIE